MPTSSRRSPKGREAALDAVWRWLGRVPFGETTALQERLRAAVVAGEGPETLLFCEHEPVITRGRSALATNILATAPELAPPRRVGRAGVAGR